MQNSNKNAESCWLEDKDYLKGIRLEDNIILEQMLHKNKQGYLVCIHLDEDKGPVAEFY